MVWEVAPFELGKLTIIAPAQVPEEEVEEKVDFEVDKMLEELTDKVHGQNHFGKSEERVITSDNRECIARGFG